MNNICKLDSGYFGVFSCHIAVYHLRMDQKRGHGAMREVLASQMPEISPSTSDPAKI